MLPESATTLRRCGQEREFHERKMANDNEIKKDSNAAPPER